MCNLHIAVALRRLLAQGIPKLRHALFHVRKSALLVWFLAPRMPRDTPKSVLLHPEAVTVDILS